MLHAGSVAPPSLLTRTPLQCCRAAVPGPSGVTSLLQAAEETPLRQHAADQGLTAVKVSVSVPACSCSMVLPL